MTGTIINIRGTSGSGKTTLARSLMEVKGGFERHHVEGRKRPIAMVSQKANLAIIGHYDTPCGGADTIPSYDWTMQVIRSYADQGYNVLYEGLLLAADVKRITGLHEAGYKLVVVHVDIPLEDCLASVNARRRAKNPEAADVNPRNTESKYKSVKTSMTKMEELGIETFTGNREECFRFIANEKLWP